MAVRPAPSDGEGVCDRIEVWIDGKRVAVHCRSYERNGCVLNLDHYLEVFLTKPGALQFSIPFKQAILPEDYHKLHRAMRCCAGPRTGDKEFVRVLMLLRDYSAEEVLWAVQVALERHSYHADAVRTLLLMRRYPDQAPPDLDPDFCDQLPPLKIPPASTQHFSRLLPKGSAVH